MVIQELLFPEIGKCTVEEMYFRKDNGKTTSFGPDPLREEMNRRVKAEERFQNEERVHIFGEKQEIAFEQYGTVWFNTYFNGFSAGKWLKYTVIDNLSLSLTLKGRFKVTLLREERVIERVITTVLEEKVVSAEEKSQVVIPYPAPEEKGMYTFVLQALEGDSVFYGGAYHSQVPAKKLREVKIAVGICTFRREPFIEKNLMLLRKHILENEKSPMYGHLEVFVSDNGKTLDIAALSTEHIHIFPNKNLGGAGGFTRDLIEMSKVKEEKKLTHALLMDDDIVIETAALVRTYILLSLLKEEYATAFVGGAMLRLDQQSIQVENGAFWDGGFLKSRKVGLDMRELEHCLFNDVEEYTDFNAWWYCCFPLSVVRDDNLPMPIFIRGDDLEYGLRNMKNLILLNGICVWHEPFEAKYSSFLEYYIMRNQLIDNAFHCTWYGKKQAKKAVWIHCRQEMMLYRYKNVDLYIRGIRDFLKGPQWLMQQDGEALHKDIMAAGYKFAPLSELPMAFDYGMLKEAWNMTENKLTRLKRRYTLNGLLVSSIGDRIVPVAWATPLMCYRRNRVMHYDITTQKGFMTQRSFKESYRCMKETFKVLREIDREYDKAKEAYRNQGLKLRTREFWNKYLGI